MVYINFECMSYEKNSCVSFRKTKESFGGLSNMCSGYSIRVGGNEFLTSEALYQACRFNKNGEIQRLIQRERSPMSAKMKSKKYRSEFTRLDWDEVRVDIMDWCLRMKLKCNWEKFGGLLLSLGDKEIIEDSHKDRFWGCVLNDEGVFEGKNILGKLLVNLRDELKNGIISKDDLKFKNIEGLKFFGEVA